MGPWRRAWENLPDLALQSIVTRLTNPVDFHSFASTCRSWHLFASEAATRADFLASLPPMLHRVEGDGDSFFGVVENRSFSFGYSSVFSLHPPPPPPSPGDKGCRFLCGASYGYLIFVDRLVHPPYNLFLVDPFTRAEIRGWFPKAPVRRKFFCFKALLTLPPDSPGCVLVLFSGKREFVRYCRRGDKRWGRIRTREMGLGNSCASLDGSRLSVFCTKKGKLLRVDLAKGAEPKITFSSADALPLAHTKVVKMTTTSSGQPLLVLFDVLDNRHYTNVYQLSEEKWERKQSLGNHSLFVDDVGCYYVDDPERWGLRSDCIYIHAMNRGVFLFCMKERNMEQVCAYPGAVLCSSNEEYRWIIPSSR